MSETASDLLLERLIDWGVDTVFGLPGDGIVILAGQGARGAADELERLAETLAAPIVKAQLGKDCVPDDSPYVTGAIGVVGTRPSQDAIEACDALVIVGSSLPYGADTAPHRYPERAAEPFAA